MTYAGVFKNITSPQLPIMKAPMGVAVEFTGDSGDAFKVSIEGNDMNLVLAEGELEAPSDLIKHQQYSATIAGEIGISFENEGVFDVILRSGETEIHRTTIGVIVLSKEANDVE